VTDTSSLDFLARYFWTRQNGETVSLATGEEITFRHDDSHRLRAGTRYTRDHNEHLSWYAGASLDYEFDGRVRASAQARGHGFELDSPSLRGGTGVGEIGLISRPTKDNRFTLECGVQA
jgi:hypothetical protein